MKKILSSCQTRLQVAYSRVESSLELLNAKVRVESRVAGREVKLSRKSRQYYIMSKIDAQDTLEVLLYISDLHRYTQLIIIITLITTERVE